MPLEIPIQTVEDPRLHWMRMPSHENPNEIVIANVESLSSYIEVMRVMRDLGDHGCTKVTPVKLHKSPLTSSEERMRLEVSEDQFTRAFPNILITDVTQVVGGTGGITR